MSLVVVIVAYLFRHLPTPARLGGMISSLIGIVMLTTFSTATQNVFFGQLSSLSMAAGEGSEIARVFLERCDMPIGQDIAPPMWQVVLPLVPVVVNMVLTVYLLMMAKWDAKQHQRSAAVGGQSQSQSGDGHRLANAAGAC